MGNYSKIFSRSLTRAVSADPDRFFSQFYDRFIPSSPEVTALFEGVDMKRQRKIIEASLAYMSEFAAFLTKTDPLERLAERHSRRGIDVDPGSLRSLARHARRDGPGIGPRVQRRSRPRMARGDVARHRVHEGALLIADRRTPHRNPHDENRHRSDLRVPLKCDRTSQFDLRSAAPRLVRGPRHRN